MVALPSPAPARMPVNQPKYTIKRDRHTSTIRIGDWTITATKRPILNGKEIEASVHLVYWMSVDQADVGSSPVADTM